MDLAHPELLSSVEIPDEEPGSAYETSEVEKSLSPDEQGGIFRSSGINSESVRLRKWSKTNTSRLTTENQNMDPAKIDNSSELIERLEMREQLQKEASEWAANFQPPKSPADIRAPTRFPAGKRSKRKASESTILTKAKRLKGFQSAEYRQFLNIDINDVGLGVIQADLGIPFDQSQLGSSRWSSVEKEAFFCSLSRFGRDNVRSIASRIGTKSEFEVQHYIQLLEHGLSKRLSQLKYLAPADIPAANEISEECCEVLEKAADAVACRQELYEAEVEHGKWGDSWRLTTEVAHILDKRRKSEKGEVDIEDVLPAANLFILSNWLELSDRIFMNSGDLGDEANWRSIAEPGETPAVRASAFEDFHSLVVHITKKLVSTTLFCTMSRERATGSNKIKHAEVSPADVEAAISILKMKPDSQDFWVRCARRCKLLVYDDENLSGIENEQDTLTYDELEFLLCPPQRSRSCSVNRPPCSGASTREPSPASSSSSDDYQSAASSPASVTDHESAALSDTSFAPAPLFNTQPLDQAQEKHLEAFDTEASKLEEVRLWALMKREPPFVIKLEPIEEAEKRRAIKREEEQVAWRKKLEFWSEWETVEAPVEEIEFLRNRTRVSKLAKEKERRGSSETSRPSEELARNDIDDQDSELEVDSNSANEQENETE